jgi:hypothetical protein
MIEFLCVFVNDHDVNRAIAPTRSRRRAKQSVVDPESSRHADWARPDVSEKTPAAEALIVINRQQFELTRANVEQRWR